METESIKKSKQHFDILIDYLKQNNFHSRVAVVDIGWEGSMQKSLQTIINHAECDVEIHGYYVGLSPEAALSEKAKSYISSCIMPHTGIRAIWELLFSSQEGSTKSYTRSHSDGILPELYPSEPRGLDERNQIENIQEGALEFLRMMKKGVGVIPLNGNTAFANLRAAGRYPRHKEILLLSGIHFQNHTSAHTMVELHSISAYIKHPDLFAEDFAGSYWRIGFLKKLFHIPLPYWSIFKVLYRILKSRE